MNKLNLLSKLAIAGVAGVIGVAAIQNKTLANPFVSQGPFVEPTPGDIVPGPLQVPGKEFSNKSDRNAANTPNPERNILWDGAGGVADGFDLNKYLGRFYYSSSFPVSLEVAYLAWGQTMLNARQGKLLNWSTCDKMNEAF